MKKSQNVGTKSAFMHFFLFFGHSKIVVVVVVFLFCLIFVFSSFFFFYSIFYTQTIISIFFQNFFSIIYMDSFNVRIFFF